MQVVGCISTWPSDELVKVSSLNPASQIKTARRGSSEPPGTDAGQDRRWLGCDWKVAGLNTWVNVFMIFWCVSLSNTLQEKFSNVFK